MTTRTTLRRTLIALAATGALAVAGCSSEQSEDETTTAVSTSSSTTESTTSEESTTPSESTETETAPTLTDPKTEVAPEPVAPAEQVPEPEAPAEQAPESEIPAPAVEDPVIGFTGAPGVDQPRVLDKEIASCGDSSIHEIGTTFFTDGTSGWTETCAAQMG